MRKLFASLRRFAGPGHKAAETANAWRNLKNGNGTVEDFELIMADLVAVTGYYRRPNYAEWMKRTQSPDGFELHSALCNARAEVLQHIMGYLNMSDAELVDLEKLARAEKER